MCPPSDGRNGRHPAGTRQRNPRLAHYDSPIMPVCARSTRRRPPDTGVSGTTGRSSDSQASTGPPRPPTDRRFPDLRGPVLLTAFVPAYRCGTVPDSHRVPSPPRNAYGARCRRRRPSGDSRHPGHRRTSCPDRIRHPDAPPTHGMVHHCSTASTPRTRKTRKPRPKPGLTMVRDTGIEPVTSSVSGKRSPAELIARGGDGNRTRVHGFAGRCLTTRPLHRAKGDGEHLLPGPTSRADDGIRTRDPHLGKVMRYQLRYIRISPPGGALFASVVRDRTLADIRCNLQIRW